MVKLVGAEVNIEILAKRLQIEQNCVLRVETDRISFSAPKMTNYDGSAIFVYGRCFFDAFVFGHESARKHRKSNEVSSTSNRSPIIDRRRFLSAFDPDILERA